MIDKQTVLRIAREEWRFWLRTKTGVAASAVVLLLVLTSLVTTFIRVETEREARLQLQAIAEETFRSQPARHPHRMIHYGHYVFRAPAPLATADPGVDPYTGTVMFLEGHKQNSATFSPRYTQADAGPYAFLSPALTYQLLVPLLLIVVGFACLSRERETRTDQLVFTMAVSPGSFWLGKSLALAALAFATLLPLAFVAIGAWIQGESGLITLVFWLGYAVYLLCWVFLITACSVWSKRASTSLLILLACWMVLNVLLPRFASSAADAWAPLASKVQSDLEIARVLRDVDDGHNANAPSFAKLRAQLLAQYNVDSVDELPINFRGLVAQNAEERLTETLNRYADRRFEQELAQANAANAFSLLSPYLALKSFSITTASTNIGQHHLFMQAAEALRFSFVQSLNKVHAEELAYADDINRSVDQESEQRTRVDAHHWRVLEDFNWEPASTNERLSGSVPFLGVLLMWALAASFLGWAGTSRGAWKQDG